MSTPVKLSPIQGSRTSASGGVTVGHRRSDLQGMRAIAVLTVYYCTVDRCPSVIGDVIVYMDVNHITATFAKSLARPLEEGLRRALGA
jgi:hypothetical protein